ncbi:hypothetical protein Mc24_04615 [Thermotoga sp. Mc24]|nr:hypothetical protein T2812B_07120 [Thermotoga sp. 2812B]EJX25675.1 hypothetical protein EMP_07767 [Thermotoga sp. EMP]KHC91336.1 hypothetical protein Mc24_04615 [Thermotoga sp. Mc24]
MTLDNTLKAKPIFVLCIKTRLVPIIHKVGDACDWQWKDDTEYAITGNEKFHAGLWYRKLCVKKGIMDDMKRQYEENLW